MLAIRAERAFDGEQVIPGGALVLTDRGRIVGVEAGEVGFSCPAIVASGPPITSPGGHCWHMGGEAQGAQQLRQAVRARAERRVDVVKVMASGGNTTPGTDVMACQFTLEELRVMVEEAHAHGLPVHCPRARAARGGAGGGGGRGRHRARQLRDPFRDPAAGARVKDIGALRRILGVVLAGTTVDVGG